MNAYEKTHLSMLRGHLAGCTVLLKKSGDFPLSAPGKIAAYGSGVRCTVKGGTGSGEVNSRFFTTVEEGLADAGFTVTTKKWLDGYDAIRKDAWKEFMKEIKARARKNHSNAMVEGMGAVMPEPEYDLPLDAEGDVAIYVLARISGEGSDRTDARGDIALSLTEIRDICVLAGQYEKFMLVVNAGGPVDLSPVLPVVKDILVLSQLGVETGAALADILLGKANPSGKLTTTWTSIAQACPVGEFGDRNDTRYNEGIYVGYRYYQTVDAPVMFPFGYGLSYTEFEMAPAGFSAEGETITVYTRVTNVGMRAGREVVQVYASMPAGTLPQPYQALAGFAKTSELAPGASEEVAVSFKLSDLASYDAARPGWVLEAGTAVIAAGACSACAKPVGKVVIPETISVLRTKNVFGQPDFEDWQPEAPVTREIPDGVPSVTVTAADIPEQAVVYGKEPDIDPLVDTLSAEELAYLNIGAFNPKGGVASVIGSAAQSVPGAAGETTPMLKEKGVPTIVMADGPAGVRISKEYFVDKTGKRVGLGGGMPESIAAMLPKAATLFMNATAVKPGKGDPVCTQYCTAIPIGTAIAQSFDVDFAKLCGDIVGDEMTRFGIHFWLAPALNIHRNIKCGRNFEYFSEDPLVSGKMAAAITAGVQQHPGCGVTIKHYSANNQETNRYANNSLVSERAMREIYQRGFGICVREAKPLSVMTSYNLINGVHTSELRGQNEDILRAEFGFDGVVMTDWVIGGNFLVPNAKYPLPHPAKVADSGNDLFMPGSAANYKDMLDGLNKGYVTLHQLKINASRVVRMARRVNEEMEAAEIAADAAAAAGNEA